MKPLDRILISLALARTNAAVYRRMSVLAPEYEGLAREWEGKMDELYRQMKAEVM